MLNEEPPALAPVAGCSLISLKNCLGQAPNPMHTLEMNYSWSGRASLCHCWIREEALQRKEEIHSGVLLPRKCSLKYSQSFTPMPEMGLHVHPGGLGSQLSRVLRAVEQGYPCPDTAELPFLAPPEPGFVLKNCTWPQIEIYIYFGDWIPAFLFAEYYCHFLRYGETQQPFLGTYCPANRISRLQSSKPKARVQECGHHMNVPGVSKFSSAFALSEVGSFPVA